MVNMIKVKIKYQDNRFVSLSITGHANSAEKGKDLVCAATSAVVTGGFNSIKECENFKIELEEGKAYIEAIKPISQHDEIVIETIISGLKTIEEENQKFIKIVKI